MFIPLLFVRIGNTKGRQNEEAASRSGKMAWTKNLNRKEPLHEKEILYWP